MNQKYYIEGFLRAENFDLKKFVDFKNKFKYSDRFFSRTMGMHKGKIIMVKIQVLDEYFLDVLKDVKKGFEYVVDLFTDYKQKIYVSGELTWGEVGEDSHILFEVYESSFYHEYPLKNRKLMAKKLSITPEEVY